MAQEEWASEDELARVLAEVTKLCDELQVDLLLIGAFAVRAYATRRRLTTDLDFVAPRSAQPTLAALFKSLGFTYSPQTHFGGVQAVKYISGEKVQLDVAIDAIRDENTGHVYVIPRESFLRKVKVEVTPWTGGAGVGTYALPPADLLISKLMTNRDQDAADAVALVLEELARNTVTDFKNKVRNAELGDPINMRLGELVRLTDRAIQSLMTDYTGGRLTGQSIRKLRQQLRRLRV